MAFEHITVDNGLSQNTISALIQDREGFIWIGTQDGLNRYDGYNFKVYEHDPLDETSLSENYIWCLYESSKGDIWVGTNNGGLNRLDKESETFTRYEYVSGDSSSISHNHIFTIYEDKLSTLWIGTYSGLNKFDPDKNNFVRFYPDSGRGEENTILSIYEDGEDDFWIGTTGGGLSKLNRKTRDWVKFFNNPADPASLSNDVVSAIFEDSFGDFWVGTGGGGLNKFDKRSGFFTRYQNIPSDKNSLSNNSIQNIFEDRNRVLWIGTAGSGLCKYIRSKQQFERIQHDPNDPAGLNNNFITALYEDANDNFWVGTAGGGLNKCNVRNNIFTHIRINPFAPSGSNENLVFSIEEDNKGVFWIGTQGDGLFSFIRGTGFIDHYLNDPDDVNSLSNNTILSILEDKFGALWIGTNGGGLNRFFPSVANKSHKPKFERYLFNSSDTTSLGSNRVKKIFEDREGKIWLALYGGGLNKFNRETNNFTRYLYDPNNSSSLSTNYIFDIVEDNAGNLWIGTWGGGLQKFDKKTEQFTTFIHDPDNFNSLCHNRVYVVCKDRTGLLWIGTHLGLNKFEDKTNTFTSYTKKDGLPSNTIMGILADDSGKIWISTNHGISVFDPAKELYTNYDVMDGLQSNEFNSGAYLKTKKGELCFGGINGINIINPDHIIKNNNIPPVVITGFKRNNEEVKLEKSITYTEEIELSYQNNSFSLEFASLDFTNPRKNKYAYILEGYDDDWIYSGNNRIATYTQVAAGNYTFRAKGTNSDGIWNEEGASVRIIINPPFYQSVWFRIIGICFLLTLLFTGYKIRVNQLNRKRELLEERVAERTEAAQKLEAALGEVEKLKDQLHEENIYLQSELKVEHNFENIISTSEEFNKVLNSVEQVASTDSTVLILGETGTGKELLARAVHSISKRSGKALVKVNCATLPDNLIESELFGHEKGAFTGATSQKVGRFELANNGTIFLDEIGELPLELQPKLLRVLQEGEFELLGNPKTIKVDVRIIASTNRDLEEAVRQGIFREDLFYRLNVFPIVIPPLRERKSDIPSLVKHFVDKYSSKIGREIQTVSQSDVDRLMKYHWPGNVRELENIIERAVITSRTNKLTLGDWFTNEDTPTRKSKNLTLDEVERDYIIQVLESTNWRVSGPKGAAKILDLPPSTLKFRMKKLNISRT